MRNIVLSAAAVIALGSFAVAGGDIAPVAPVEPAAEGNFYVGGAYSKLDARQTEGYRESPTINDEFEAVMLQAGYKFNPYIAVEARFWYGLEETISSASNYVLDFDTSMNVWGIYAKPMYPVTEEIDVYGLLGYTSTDYDVSNVSIDGVDGLSWGVGAAYSFANNYSVFADYVSIYEDDNDLSDDRIYSYNFGVSYQF